MTFRLQKMESISYWKYVKLKKCLTYAAFPYNIEGLNRSTKRYSKSQLLGEFFHEIMDSFNNCDPEKIFSATALNSKFNEIIDKFNSNLSNDLGQSIFGDLSEWPEVSEIYESVYELFKSRSQRKIRGKCKVNSERILYSKDRKLSGKIDAYIVEENAIDLFDYKSGSFEKDSIRFEDYKNQLYFYAYLIHEEYGVYPRSLKFIGRDLESKSLHSEPSKSMEIANDMRRKLEFYNQKVSETSEVNQNTSPSSLACKYCDFKINCESFWRSVNNLEHDEYNHVIIGQAVGKIESSKSGSSVAKLKVEKGTVNTSEISLGKLFLKDSQT